VLSTLFSVSFLQQIEFALQTLDLKEPFSSNNHGTHVVIDQVPILWFSLVCKTNISRLWHLEKRKILKNLAEMRWFSMWKNIRSSCGFLSVLVLYSRGSRLSFLLSSLMLYLLWFADQLKLSIVIFSYEISY